MKEQTNRNKPLYAKQSKAADALAIMPLQPVKLDKIADQAKFSRAGVDVMIFDYSRQQASIGVNVHKLFSFSIAMFTDQYNGLQAGGYEVAFSLDEYIKITGGKLSADRKQRRRKRNDMQKRIRRELMLLQSLQFTQISGTDSFESISPFCRTAARNGVITIEFSRPFAEILLKKKAVTIVHPGLMRISARSRTAYALGQKCTRHYYKNRRRNSKAARRLKVKNLLKETLLPNYEDVLKDRKGWRERILLPFEKAMNELVAEGVLTKWQYEGAGTAQSYQAFKETVIYFEVSETENVG